MTVPVCCVCGLFFNKTYFQAFRFSVFGICCRVNADGTIFSIGKKSWELSALDVEESLKLRVAVGIYYQLRLTSQIVMLAMRLLASL
jgi:hypothetical protein